jgi:hypothetical protein
MRFAHDDVKLRERTKRKGFEEEKNDNDKLKRRRINWQIQMMRLCNCLWDDEFNFLAISISLTIPDQLHRVGIIVAKQI